MAIIFVLLVLCLPLALVVAAGCVALRRRPSARGRGPNAAQRLIAQFYRS